MDFVKDMKESVTPLVDQFKESVFNSKLDNQVRHDAFLGLAAEVGRLSCGKRRYLLREVEQLKSDDPALDQAVVSVLRNLCAQVHVSSHDYIVPGIGLSTPLANRISSKIARPSNCFKVPVFLCVTSGGVLDLNESELTKLNFLYESVSKGCIKSLNTLANLAHMDQLPHEIWSRFSDDYISAKAILLHEAIGAECEDMYIFKDDLYSLMLTDELLVPESIKAYYETPSISSPFQLRVSRDNLNA